MPTMMLSSGDAAPPPLSLHVILFQEEAGSEQVWVAQCLDYDIAAHGSTIRDAQAQFERAVIGEIVVALEHGEVPLAGIVPAPARYQELWERAVRLAEPVQVTPAADASPAIRARPERVPRGQAEFRIAG